MKVVILCGGKGTRLREETEYRPKPMVSIGSRPILWHIMKTYAHYGHTDFILCLGYKGEVIKEYFRNYYWNTTDVAIRLGATVECQFIDPNPEQGWRITLADTGQEAMTGARINSVKKYVLPDETFLLTYGDCVADINIGRCIEQHHASNNVLTVSAVHPPGRFGELGLGDDDRLLSFNEKPQTSAGYISGGFFVASRGIFDYLSGDLGLHFEREPIDRLLQDKKVGVYRHDGFWHPMDTYGEYLLLNRIWDSGKAPWKVWGDKWTG